MPDLDTCVLYYSTFFGQKKFRNWITRLTKCIPDFQ